jgi:tRNA pseudouridine55 synthase
MNGVLLLNKPVGMTSHDCVFKLRKLLKIKKIGHTGTLDPDVTGVLPICIGKATKIAEYLTGESKTYEGEVTLGFSTTTEDAKGEIVEVKKVDRRITKNEIEELFRQLNGEMKQTPPMYSAVKVNGKKLYEYARAGIEIERQPRRIFIHDIVLLETDDIFEGNQISLRFRVTCSKGTYVRTLAVTIGEKLGFPAHMSDLKRTASGSFTIAQCITFQEVEELLENGELSKAILSIEDALAYLPKLEINDTVAEKVKNGAVLPIDEEAIQLSREDIFLMINKQNQCLAIYQLHPTKEGYMKPVKVLLNDQELS